jgi:hypothetical protein
MKNREAVSAYDNWREFDTLDAAELRAIEWHKYRQLADVRCLQPCPPTSRLTVVGGVPTGEPGTWFGHAAVLPSVRVSGGANVVWMRETREDVALDRELRFLAEDMFAIDAQSWGEPLEGGFVVTARIGGELERTLRKNIRFRAFADRHEYKPPFDPRKWLCEASCRDTSVGNGEAFSLGAPPSPSFATRTRAPRSFTAPQSASEEELSRTAAVTEICVAIANRRCGFAEGDLLELFKTVLGIAEVSVVRQVLRAWVEAGHFDCAVSLTWRARRYFARDPRLVAVADSSGVRARLVGLSPAMLTHRLREYATKLGGETRQYPSWSTWIQGPWEVRGLSLVQAQELSHNLGLGEMLWVPSPETLIPKIDRLERMLAERPMNYSVVRRWCWRRVRFVDLETSATNEKVQILWCQRSDKLDRPDYFVVQSGAKEVFCSYSRNWALLVAGSLVGAMPFVRDGNGLIMSKSWPWVHLPPSVGRWAFAAGSGAAGPCRDDQGQLRYFYPLVNGETARIILEKLGLEEKTSDEELPRWLLRLATKATGNDPLVTLPRTTGRAVSLRRVPLSLRPVILAHLRRNQ